MSASLYTMSGKTALVTGAARGIGFACAKTLAAQGASIVITDVNEDSLASAYKELAESGYDVAHIVQDVTEEDAWKRVMEVTHENFGRLDVLVNNAGIYVGGTVVSNSVESVRDVHRVNVDSIFLGMKYAAVAMRVGSETGRGGSVVNMSSVAGLIGVPGHSAYGSTKGAVRSYTKHAAVEFATLGYGIRVNSVHPGLIDTEMGDKVYPDLIDIGVASDIEQAKQIIKQMTPLGRVGTVQDVANMVLFLASDASAYVTGAEFVVDGGMTAA